MKTKNMSELLNEEEMRLFKLCIPFKDLENGTYANHIWTKEEMYNLVSEELKEHDECNKELTEQLKTLTDEQQIKIVKEVIENGNEYANKLEDLRHTIAYLMV